MKYHANARLTLSQRQEAVLMIEEGMTFREAAASLNVASATVHRWWCRFKEGTHEERWSMRCLHDRSSRPVSSPGMLSRAEQQRICEVRKHTGWGPRLIAPEVGYPHSTVHAALRRNGYSRLPKAPKANVKRYEWPCPGDLLHMDTKRYARFDRPGHAVTGDRTVNSKGAGYEYAHSIVDDHSRLAYSEIHPDERGETVVGFTERALAFFAKRGIATIVRLMTDNAWCYTRSADFAALLSDHGIRHFTTKPYTPQTNGKVERYQQTMAREWGYGQTYNSSADRQSALSYWLEHYNERRPHSGIAGRSPISRVHNVSGQNI